MTLKTQCGLGNKMRGKARGRRSRCLAGFTLVELMIVVAIVALLATIAVPSYNQYMEDVRREDGRETLLKTAQLLERCYTTHGSYTDSNCNVSFPRDSEDGFYQIPQASSNAVMALAASSYTLVAEPQAGHADDECGQLTLANTGAKGLNGADAGVTVDDCW